MPSPTEHRRKVWRSVVEESMRPGGGLRPAQQSMVRHLSANKFSATLGARQWGKSTAFAYCACCLSLGLDPATGDDVMPDSVHIVSKTEAAAQDVIRRVRYQMENLFDVGVEGATRRKLTAINPRFTSAAAVKTALGTEIVAHAGNPDSIQGMSGHVFADEIAAGRYPAEELYAQAMSAASGNAHRRLMLAGNAARIPRGDSAKSHNALWWRNFWHGGDTSDELRRKHFARQLITIHDVWPGGLPDHLAMVCDAMGGESSESWRQWYLCEFIEGFESALDSVDVAALTVNAPVADGPVWIGIDPGGHVNPTGYCAARVSGHAVTVLDAGYWFGQPSKRGQHADHEGWAVTQVAHIQRLVDAFRPQGLIVDYSNLGAHLGDALRARWGNAVELVATATDSRQRRWGVLHSLVRDRTLHVPDRCQDLIADLRRLEIDHSSGNPTKIRENGVLVLPRAKRDEWVLHCDAADALMLVCEKAHAMPATRGVPGAVRARRIEYGPRH